MLDLASFIGNKDLIRLLRISIAAARETNRALPHTLLYGPPGTGKTSLAEAIAKEFGCELFALTPQTAKKAETLRKLFLSLPGQGYDREGKIVGRIHPQVLFCDEVHQMPLLAQENLGIAMQDWKLPVNINGIDVFEWVPRFTLIGATTLPGKLSKPFLDRFRIQANFEIYTHEECKQIVRLHANKLGLILEEGVEELVARRSRGVARLIVRFLDRIRDANIAYSLSHPDQRDRITTALVEVVFKDFLKIDSRGLTRTDLKILRELARYYEPIGIELLASAVNEDPKTVENTVEPYLLQQGLLIRTKRGRMLTDDARRYLEANPSSDTNTKPAFSRVMRGQ